MFDKKIKKFWIAPFVVCLLLHFPSLSLADSLVVEINSGAYIVNPDTTNARLLLRFDLPQELLNTELIFAELLVPITSVIPDSSALRVFCHPLLVSWNPDDIVWDDLGDSLRSEITSEDGTHYATSDEGNQEGYFDITDMVRAWHEGRIDNNGLILFYNAGDPPYFRFTFDPDSPLAGVKIFYTY